MEKNESQLLLKNQICFPLYACSKEIVRQYKPFLDELDLTYTQYITMLVMWEHKQLNVKEIGSYLYLDSGTLTPLLKKLEDKGYIVRTRSKADERNLSVTLTKEGIELQAKAVEIPEKVGQCVNFSAEDSLKLYELLYKLLDTLS